MKRSADAPGACAQPPPSYDPQRRHCNPQRRHLPLTAVSTVCMMHALPDTLPLTISSFVTKERWTIEKASELGSTPLLQHMLTLEDARAHPLYKSHFFSRALVHAVKHDNAMELLECLSAYCPRGNVVAGMTEAARLGKVPVMERLVANCKGNITWSPDFVCAAASGGHLDALQWLRTHFPKGIQNWERSISRASTAGHLQTVKWLHENVPRSKLSTRERAFTRKHGAKQPERARVKDLLENGYKHLGFDDPVDSDLASIWNDDLTEWFQNVLSSASEKGHTETVRWLIEHGPKLHFYDSVYLMALENNHLEIARLVHPLLRFPGCYAQSMLVAVRRGHFDIVKWIYRDLRGGCSSANESDSIAVSYATGNGFFPIAEWLHAQRRGQETPRYHLYPAIANGEFESVKWLVENFDPDLHDQGNLDVAAYSGNLEMLIWLKSKWKVGFSSDAMKYAAKKNHLHVMKWLHEIGAECTPAAMDEAASNGHLRVVEWLHENRSEGCTTRAMDRAAKNGHLHVVKWLHKHRTEGCTTKAMDKANTLEIVEWLHANRTEGCTTKAMDNAAKNGDFDTLLFLHENYNAGCTIEAAVLASIRRHGDIILWLVENYPDVINIDELRSTYMGDGAFIASLFARVESVKRQRVA